LIGVRNQGHTDKSGAKGNAGSYNDRWNHWPPKGRNDATDDAQAKRQNDSFQKGDGVNSNGAAEGQSDGQKNAQTVHEYCLAIDEN
jgi:hypothetical protein